MRRRRNPKKFLGKKMSLTVKLVLAAIAGLAAFFIYKKLQAAKSLPSPTPPSPQPSPPAQIPSGTINILPASYPPSEVVSGGGIVSGDMSE